jgi:hypothetical protein
MGGIRTGVAALMVGLAGMIGAGAAVERRDVDEMADAANRFLEALSDSQRAEATFPFDSAERERHHFIPPETFERHGTVLKEMSSEQQDRAQDLLRAGLSQQGHLTAREIMEVEGILAELEGPDRQFARHPEEYWISIFGSPSTTGTWGWRWEGHHLSLHFTIVEGEMTVSTPSFLSANPAEVPAGHPRAGLRPLARQEDTARSLLASLDAAQLQEVIFDETAPGNILTGADNVVDPLDPIGIAAFALSYSQRRMLMAVIDSYVSVMADDIAALRMAKIRDAGTDEIRFAWAGSTERGQVAYYRVQGPTFLIEYDNTQEDPNHIHAAFRDFDGDLGRDILREHLEQDH